MTESVWGIVKAGVVVPQSPLPEGARVQILLEEAGPDVPLELEEELAAWQQASAEALVMVERLAQEGEADEKR